MTGIGKRSCECGARITRREREATRILLESMMPVGDDSTDKKREKLGRVSG